MTPKHTRDPHPFFSAWASLLHTHGITLAVILTVLTTLLGWQVYRKVSTDGVPLDFTPQSIFLDDGEMVQQLRDIEEQFGREDNDFLILLTGDGLTSDAGKNWLEQLHQQLETVDAITQVFSLVNAPRISNTDGLLEMDTVWNEASPWRAVQEQPMFKNILSNSEGTVQVLQARVEQSREKVSDLQPVYDELLLTIQNHPPPMNIKWQITGVPYIRTEVVDLMLEDELFYVPVSAVMFFCTIVWLFRGIHLALAPVAAVQIGMAWAVGLLIVSDVTFNILSMLIPAIAMVIGIADGIHLVSRYREERAQSSNRILTLARTLEEMSMACFWTTFTTAGGFASLLVADTMVVRDFGLHSAVAVLTTYIGIMILIPLWLRFIPDHVFAQNLANQPTWTPFFNWIHQTTRLRKRVIILGSGLVCILMGVVASNISADSYILEMYDEEHPTVTALHTMEEHLSGIVPVFIYLEAETDLYTVEGLQTIEALEQKLHSYDFIRWSSSIASQHSVVHKAITSSTGLPTTDDMLAQERLLLDLSGGLPSSNILSEDGTKARILLLCRDIGGVEFLNFKREFDDFAATTLRGTGVQSTVTGDGMLASIGIDKLIGDLMNSVGLVFGIILVVLSLLLRDIAHTLLAFVPNVLPLLTTLAFLELAGRDLQVSNIVSFTVAIGLAVDDTIHFVARYRSERSSGQTHEEAMKNTIHGAGYAIVLTSILLICGFGLLTTSQLSSTFYFGTLTAVTLLSAIVADLFLLPALLNWWEDKRERHQ